MSDRMAVKRNVDPRWEENGGYKRRHKPIGSNLEEIMRQQCMDSVPHFLEPFLRNLVREEVDKALSYYLSSSAPSLKQIIHSPKSRRWQLQFNKKLHTTLFATSKIEAYDNSPLHVSIYDTFSNTIVSPLNLSSIQTEVVVLDGNFRGGDWTEKEFNDSLVREREGKRPLLSGDVCITLNEEGKGQLGDVYFTDNSSWTRSRKFRLGLRVTTKGTQIKEAITEAFVVKDHRGELYKKHHPPSLDDQVWRLEKIGKDGVFHRKLVENGINTVQDFLKSFVVNQGRLRSIFGNGMSSRMWEVIVRHIKECCVDNQPCYYYTTAQGQIYFDNILQAVGVKFHDDSYQQFAQLGAENQEWVNKMKENAYRNQNQIAELYTPQSLLIQDAPTLHTPILRQVEPSIQEQLVPSSTATFSTEGEFAGQMQEENGTGESTSCWGDVGIDPFLFDNSSFNYDFGDAMFRISESEIRGNHSLPLAGFSDSHLSPSKWIKLIAALKCAMLIRKRLAAKRRAKTVQFNYQSCYTRGVSL